MHDRPSGKTGTSSEIEKSGGRLRSSGKRQPHELRTVRPDDSAYEYHGERISQGIVRFISASEHRIRDVVLVFARPLGLRVFRIP